MKSRWLHIICLVVPALLFCAVATAQTSDSELAQYYFRNGEFDKAAMYYEKLYEQSPNDVNYRYLLSSYEELGDFKTAERLIKQQLKRTRNDSRYQVDLGRLYSRAGDPAKGEKEYDQAIKNLQPQQREIINLANAFIRHGLYGQAMQTYERGKKLLKDSYPFHYEMANLYGVMGEFEPMVEQYLTLLEVSQAYLQTVQNALNRYIDFQEEHDKVEQLRIKLLRKTQRNPDNDTYAELLIWLFTQKKSFNSALIQVKALDRRRGEDGNRVMKLAQMCLTNKDYKTAAKCFEYVAEKEPRSPYYTSAKMNLVNTRKLELENNPASDREDFATLETLYFSTLSGLGRSANTAGMMKELALLQAFRLQKADTAVQLLNETLQLPNMQASTIAETKMALADILLSEGDIWEASLLYSQVEKDHKHDMVGHEAKFRNAKVYYYTGDFEWAQAQLDVLKASTTKLIANDAMELSLLITDNFALDTIREPMIRFARADLLIYQGRLAAAEAALDSLSNDLTFHALQDDILYQRYKIALQRKEHEKCRSFLTAIMDHHGHDLLGDNAVYELARLEETIFENKDRAMELYRKLLLEHQGSLFVVEARKRFRELRGDFNDANLPDDEL